MKKSISSFSAVAFAALIAASSASQAAVSVSLTPSTNNIGYMNVSELPSNGGGYVFGQAWGFNDTRANFTGTTLKLEAAPINDTSSFWYQGTGTNPGGPGAPGNKQMDANAYVQDDTLGGQTVSFSMTVTANTLTANGYTSVAFIKDFAPDYSSNTSVTVPLNVGTFTLTKATTAGDHIQYGFETIGANVWPTDVASKGFITIAPAVSPEPASLSLLGAAGTLLLRRRRA